MLILMRLCLINPSNPFVSSVNASSRWNRYRVWKPLGLLVLAGLTPPEWEITIIDENLRTPDYASLPRPDLVGVTAFTSQAPRAYELAAGFRRLGVPVVMGGIHASMCVDEALGHVDSVVTGEGEGVWPRVLDDARRGCLQRRYDGGYADMGNAPLPRHDLLNAGYAFGSIQTTRGCPLNCSFCSVSAFNGTRYRDRPVDDVVRELAMIREKLVLVVDDNLIGTRPDHVARAKDLFRAIVRARLHKSWVCQATINFADDDELMALAVESGCRGVFIGFESTDAAGLRELGKRFNLLNARDFRASVRRIQRHNILVVGSFIMGLDTDEPGIGERIADAASTYGVDSINVGFLTPLPGTRLWEQMRADNRIASDAYPDDWKYYTLNLPVARFRHFTRDAIFQEMAACSSRFYSVPRLLSRVCVNVRQRRTPLISLIANLSYRRNYKLDRHVYANFVREQQTGNPPSIPSPK